MNRIKKVFTSVFIFAIVFSLFPVVVFSQAEVPPTWTVCAGGGCDYPDLQTAIDDDINVTDDSILNVTGNLDLGATPVTVDKRLAIQCDAGVTLTNGDVDGRYIMMFTDGSFLGGCTFYIDTCDDTDVASAISIYSADVTIDGNTFTNTAYAIDGDGNATIQNNTLNNICNRGIQVTGGAGTLTIDNNTITSDDGDRMVYLFGRNGGTILCTDNTVSQSSSVAPYPAIILSDTLATTTYTITGNTVKAIAGANGFGSGVSIGDADGKDFANVTIQNNIFNGVDTGVYLYEASISDSNISHNTIYGATGTGLFSAGEGIGKTIENLVLKYNIVYLPVDSDDVGVSIESDFTVTNFTEDYNAYYNESDSCVSVTGVSTGSHSLCATDNSNGVDPAFTGASSDDFSLLPFSYMIGYADDGSDLGAVDYSGSRRTTFYVDDDGVVDYATCDSNTINGVMDYLAPTGDTVEVAGGTYAETVAISGRTVDLRGEQIRTYTMKNSPYSYLGHDYDSEADEGLYLFYDNQNIVNCATGDIFSVDAGVGESYNEDITSVVLSPPVNYALALATLSDGATSSYKTFLLPDTCSTDPNGECFTTQSQLESYLDDFVAIPACGVTSYTVDYFENDIYTYNTSTDLYTYHAPSDAGVTVMAGHPTPPSITIDAGTTTTIDASGHSYGLNLSNVDDSTVSGFTIQDASLSELFVSNDSDGNTFTDLILSGVTSASTYLINKHSYSYDGSDWNTGDAGGATGGGLLVYGLGGGDMRWFESDGTDVGSIVGSPPKNWHLGLLTVGGNKYTAYHRSDVFANQAAANAFWAGMGATVDYWFADVFTYSGGEYTYNAPAGPSVMGAYSSPPAISTSLLGGALVFSSSDNNTADNITLSGNQVGVNFIGTASGNTVKDSTFSSNTVDLASSASADNSVKNSAVASSSVSSAGAIEIFEKIRAYLFESGSPVVGAIFTLSNAASVELLSKTTSSTGYTGYSDYLTVYKITNSGNINTGNDHTYTITSGSTTSSSKTLTIDSADQVVSVEPEFVAPTGLANFTGSYSTTGTVGLSWDGVTDANFDHYEIWYGLVQADLQGRTGTSIEWDTDDDADLSLSATTSTVISGLTEGSTYYFKVWAIDTWGNESTVDDVSVLVQAPQQQSSGSPGLSYSAPAAVTAPEETVSEEPAEVEAVSTEEAPGEGIDEEEILRKAASTVTDSVEKIIVPKIAEERTVVERKNPVFLLEESKKINSLIEQYELETVDREIAERFIETDFAQDVDEVFEAISGQNVVDNKLAVAAQKEVSKAFIDSIGGAILEKSASVSLNLGGGVRIDVDDVDDIEVLFTNVMSEQKLIDAEADALERGVVFIKANERTDLDDNGVPDFIQMKYGLGLYQDDLDEDGWSLADEIGWGLNPYEVDSIPDLPELTNMDGFVTGATPQFKFIGESGSTADVWVIRAEENENLETVRMKNKEIFASVLLADMGEDISDSAGELSRQIYVGEVVIDASNKATLVPDEPLSDGQYYVVVRDEDFLGNVKSFSVIDGQMLAPELELVGGVEKHDVRMMSFEDALLNLGKTIYRVLSLSERVYGVNKDDFLHFHIEKLKQIDVIETSFIVEGSAEPGETLYVTWESVILSSVVISDASQGSFKLDIPDEFAEGEEHEVLAYVVDEKNNIMSSVTRILIRR